MASLFLATAQFTPCSSLRRLPGLSLDMALAADEYFNGGDPSRLLLATALVYGVDKGMSFSTVSLLINLV